MTMQYTDPSLTNGGEPIGLLKALGFEYLAELNRTGLVEFVESVGMDGMPVLIAIIPHVKIVDGKIMDVGMEIPEEKPANELEGGNSEILA